jgi:hypothetical protein
VKRCKMSTTSKDSDDNVGDDDGDAEPSLSALGTLGVSPPQPTEPRLEHTLGQTNSVSSL